MSDLMFILTTVESDDGMRFEFDEETGRTLSRVDKAGLAFPDDPELGGLLAQRPAAGIELEARELINRPLRSATKTSWPGAGLAAKRPSRSQNRAAPSGLSPTLGTSLSEQLNIFRSFDEAGAGGWGKAPTPPPTDLSAAQLPLVTNTGLIPEGESGALARCHVSFSDEAGSNRSLRGHRFGRDDPALEDLVVGSVGSWGCISPTPIGVPARDPCGGSRSASATFRWLRVQRPQLGLRRISDAAACGSS